MSGENLWKRAGDVSLVPFLSRQFQRSNNGFQLERLL